MTVGIVGLGLIGGSIGLGLREPSNRILGVDVRPESCATAVSRGCVDAIVEMASLDQAEVVFVAVPPAYVAEVLTRVMGSTPAVVTDCTSVKGPVVRLAETESWTRFVPGHPMAGHEKGGAEFASAWMFRNAKWLLTPTSKTDKKAIKLVEKVVSLLGATPISVSAEQHDRHVALLSHFPHVLAASLVRMASGLERADVGGGSWRDLTRVGGADPVLWTQILLENRESILALLEEFSGELVEVQSALRDADAGKLGAFFESARKAKGSL